MENILIYIILGLIAIVIALIVFILLLKSRIDKFMSGKKAGSLEELIGQIFAQNEKITNRQDLIEKGIMNINGRVQNGISGIGIVRFNPFKESGGNQSFAISFLNEHGDGVVISSLYSREKTSVFSKPVKGGKSDFELTDEEREAIKKALK